MQYDPDIKLSDAQQPYYTIVLYSASVNLLWSKHDHTNKQLLQNTPDNFENLILFD